MVTMMNLINNRPDNQVSWMLMCIVRESGGLNDCDMLLAIFNGHIKPRNLESALSSKTIETKCISHIGSVLEFECKFFAPDDSLIAKVGLEIQYEALMYMLAVYATKIDMLKAEHFE